MSNALFDGLHNGLGRVLDLRMQQHSLTAANLANADTPGYKAKFIPFDKVLGEAVNRRQAPPMRQTHALHSAGFDADTADPSVDHQRLPGWQTVTRSIRSARPFGSSRMQHCSVESVEGSAVEWRSLSLLLAMASAGNSGGLNGTS